MGKGQEETQTLCQVKRQMKQGFEALCPVRRLKAEEAPGTADSDPTADINVVCGNAVFRRKIHESRDEGLT